MMRKVEAGVLWYASICNTFDWLRYIPPMALKLAMAVSGQGLKRQTH